MAVVPPEVITGVLCRLPVKSLLRFRCVSKHWCSEIDSPYFIKLHLNLSTASKSKLSIVGSSYIPLRKFYFSINSDSEVTEIDAPFTNSYKIKPTVCGSSNGLLLLRTSVFYPSTRILFFLFNPSTRKHFVIPDSLEPIEHFHEENCFLVYDAMNDDYKVFSILLRNSYDSWNKRYTWITTEARVYSLKSNSWRVIINFEDSVMDSKTVGYLCWNIGFTYVNGALHSINEKRDPMKSIVAREIIAVDIESGVRRVMPLPESMVKYDLCFMTDALIGGCLCALCEWVTSDEYTISVDIWVMKEYGVRESWSVLLSVVFPEFCRFRGHLIYYSNSCNEILLHHQQNHRCDQLVWHDLQTGATRNFLAHGFPIKPQHKSFHYVESLVPVHIL